MINKKSWGAVILLFLGVHNVSAQPYVDILNVQYQRFASVPYLASQDNQVTAETFGSLFIPLEMASKDVILLGASYNSIKCRSSNDTVSNVTLYGTSLQIGGIKQWHDSKWSTMLLAIPKISSDYKNISAGHFQMGGVILFIYSSNETLKYKFGLFYNREFFGNYYIPLAGLEWKVSERLNVFGVLPGGMNMEYRIAQGLYAGVSYKSTTATYRLSRNNEQYYVREGHRFWGSNQVRGFVSLYPTKRLVLFSEFGLTAWRRYELYENGRSNNQTPLQDPLFGRFRNGFFVNAGMALRVRLDD